MSSIENWLLANEYASRLLVKLSLCVVLLQGMLLVWTDALKAVLTTLALWITALVITLMMTEAMLRKRN